MEEIAKKIAVNTTIAVLTIVIVFVLFKLYQKFNGGCSCQKGLNQQPADEPAGGLTDGQPMDFYAGGSPFMITY